MIMKVRQSPTTATPPPCSTTSSRGSPSSPTMASIIGPRSGSVSPFLQNVLMVLTMILMKRSSSSGPMFPSKIRFVLIHLFIWIFSTLKAQVNPDEGYNWVWLEDIEIEDKMKEMMDYKREDEVKMK